MLIDLISKMREMTGAGIMDCRNALKESKNDIDLACELLRKKNSVIVVKKIGRCTKHGLVHSYIHGDGILGVLVELNCETDFVARTSDFRNLIKEISMQIAAVSPIYVSRDQVPKNIIEYEKEIYKSQIKDEYKSKNILDKIIEGKIEKFYSQVCLYDQVYIKDTSGKETIKDLISNVIVKVGENIVVKRFSRFKIGDE
jgi:elongation factor Ts